ncbi:hypothetical protein JL721_13092 [Aureococcus anophagefferens]|nr:hypothetical protein JL721_13092 [Aureococcus anophagefferens]
MKAGLVFAALAATASALVAPSTLRTGVRSRTLAPLNIEKGSIVRILRPESCGARVPRRRGAPPALRRRPAAPTRHSRRYWANDLGTAASADQSNAAYGVAVRFEAPPADAPPADAPPTDTGLFDAACSGRTCERSRLGLEEPLSGLAAHPAVDVVDSAHHADVVLWLPQWAAKAPSASLALTKLRDLGRARRPRAALGPYAAQRGDAYLAYFKRSFANKSDGAFLGFSEPLFPRYYAMQYVSQRERLSGFFGEFDTSQRNVISAPYFALMRRARVVVTCNPGDWEGDFRTWEAVVPAPWCSWTATTPMPHAFVDGDDAYIYDNGDGPAFKARLGGALAPANASRTAEAGERGLRRRSATTAVSRVDWLLGPPSRSTPSPGPFRAPGFDEPELGHALLARALATPPPLAAPRPTKAQIAELRSALFLHPDGRVFEGKRATTAALASRRRASIKCLRGDLQYFLQCVFMMPC